MPTTDSPNRGGERMKRIYIVEPCIRPRKEAAAGRGKCESYWWDRTTRRTSTDLEGLARLSAGSS